MIRNVIFDLSEVLLPGMIGVEVSLEAATGIPRERITKAMGSHPHYEVGNVLDNLLRGALTYEEYRSIVLNGIGLSERSREVFDKHCLAMLSEPYGYTEQLLRTASSVCDIFLLSDHCEVWASYICKRHSFMDRFKDIVWSYEVGATKRDSEPFEQILSRNSLAPENTLFVDDLARNIEMAKRFGLRTIHFKGESSVQNICSVIETANKKLKATR